MPSNTLYSRGFPTEDQRPPGHTIMIHPLHGHEAELITIVKKFRVSLRTKKAVFNTFHTTQLVQPNSNFETLKAAATTRATTVDKLIFVITADKVIPEEEA